MTRDRNIMLTCVALTVDGNVPQAPRSDLPVLLIIGRDDPTSNQAALGTTKRLIPQVQIELIEGVGHWVMVECRDHINESIPKFLQANLPNAVPKL